MEEQQGPDHAGCVRHACYFGLSPKSTRELLGAPRGFQVTEGRVELCLSGSTLWLQPGTGEDSWQAFAIMQMSHDHVLCKESVAGNGERQAQSSNWNCRSWCLLVMDGRHRASSSNAESRDTLISGLCN